MLTELALSTVLVVLTVLIHALGLLGLTRLLRLEQHANEHTHYLPVAKVKVSLLLILGLMALHGAQIWLYALVFVGIDAVPTLRTAVYFSTISYAAIGYSDAAIKPAWDLVAAIEGINGLLLIGWSTAYLVTVMARLRR